MNRVIFIVGMPGSGKSIAADQLAGQGFSYVRFGQIVMDKIKEQGIEVNEKNEKKIREGLRKEHGMEAFAILSIPKIDNFLKNSNVVGDGLYSWSEYKVLKERYGKRMIIIAVYAPPSLRYKRLAVRSSGDDEEQRFRAISKEDAKKRDYAEIESLEKGGPIAMADFTIINIGSPEELKSQIKSVLERINDKN